jgi:hypothetical protein
MATHARLALWVHKTANILNKLPAIEKVNRALQGDLDG